MDQSNLPSPIRPCILPINWLKRYHRYKANISDRKTVKTTYITIKFEFTASFFLLSSLTGILMFQHLFPVIVIDSEMKNPSTISSDNFNWSELTLFHGFFMLASDCDREHRQASSCTIGIQINWMKPWQTNYVICVVTFLK